MKCSKCGFELEDNALFCHECGTKIEKKELFCHECGGKLAEGAKFCSFCGTQVSLVEKKINNPHVSDVVETIVIPNTFEDKEHNIEQYDDIPESGTIEILEPTNTQNQPETSLKTVHKPTYTKRIVSGDETTKLGLSEKLKASAAKIWSRMDVFSKVITVSFVVVLFILLLSLLKHNLICIILSLLQVVCLIYAALIHKGYVQTDEWSLKYVVWAATILLSAIIFMNFSINNTNVPNNKQQNNTQVIPNADKSDGNNFREDIEYSLSKGTEFAYMTDEWNVYIATAVSDELIKIENWDKTMSNDKSVEHEYDVGTFAINDSENNFFWVDKEHTTFAFTFTDEKNEKFKKGNTAIFTINNNDSDNNKGSNFTEEIACYKFQHDDWHMYRAIPMSDDIIKIECWSRTSSLDKFLFGYDVGVISTTDNTTDFKWTDDEYTSFTITMKDYENDYYWKEETFVLFELETLNHKYNSVKSFLGRWEIGEGEAAVPASAFDFMFEDYKDVQKLLEDAGFTNISTSIKYDIILGWTSEGEVDSVSINGNTEYEKGEVFNADTPIVITYHMKAEDDPNNKSEVESTPTPEPTEEPQSAVFYSTNTYDVAKNGDSGIYSYKSKGGSYDIYWIIDFDAGYVYYFIEGNGDNTCDRLKIDSGDLNNYVKITYHDGSDIWSYKLHFKYVNHPEHLVMIDNDGFDYDYYTTDLSKALKLRNTKTIKDY